MLWCRAIHRERSLRECLEIQQAGISPPPGIFCLTLKTFQLAVVASRVHIRFHCLPYFHEFLGLSHSPIISIAEIFPKRKSVLHSEIPTCVMEPQEILFRTSVYIVIRVWRKDKKTSILGVHASSSALQRLRCWSIF